VLRCSADPGSLGNASQAALTTLQEEHTHVQGSVAAAYAQRQDAVEEKHKAQEAARAAEVKQAELTVRSLHC